MIRLSTIVVATIAGLSTTATMAADLLAASPITVPDDLFDWTGLYAGVQVGYAVGTGKFDDMYNYQPDSEGGGINRYTAEPDLLGWLGGAHVGYLHQFDALVVGAESDLNWSGVSGNGYFFYHNNLEGTIDGPSAENVQMDFLWDGSSRVKAGLAMDQLLAFATAGVAYAQVDITDHRDYGDSGIHDFKGTANLLGWTAGAGLSYALSDNIVLTGEYRYTSYGEDSGSFLDGTNDNSRAYVSGDLHRATAAISFKF